MKPLVSCLCVTRNRVQLLRRAVFLFKAQTYPNTELVIVYESDDPATRNCVEGIEAPGIVCLEVPAAPDVTLASLRNLAVEKCNGDYFCQWDDDDWYHPKRLELQMRVIKESRMPASILLHWLVFDSSLNRAYISCRRPWEGSLLCKKSIIDDYGIQYRNMAVSEDTAVIKSLFANHLVFPIMMPKLYIYVYHGSNVWHIEHWQKIFAASTELSRPSSLLIEEILNGTYSPEEAAERLDVMEG